MINHQFCMYLEFTKLIAQALKIQTRLTNYCSGRAWAAQARQTGGIEDNLLKNIKKYS